MSVKMKKEFTLSIIISLTFLSLGFLLLHYQLIGYGLSFFVFLPFFIGYILGKSTIRKFSLYGLLFSLTIFCILLLAGGLEGMVCLLMAMPLVLITTILGYAVKRFIERNKKTNQSKDIIKSSILPLILFLGFGFLENELTKNDKEIISVKTEMLLPYTTTEVYETIKSVDTLIADKPFLMKLDLPIPNKCILEKEEVGGIRTCYFSGGTITERITELEKAKVLRMDVIDYKLTGRKWLGFKEAIYYFDKIGQDSSRLTRITTYTSVLTPRFYWQPLEKIGISQEHDYVFDNLKNDLKRKYGGK
jgi:hypothetical protein